MPHPWPSIPYEPWRASADGLHRWLQIVGKYRLARTPWVNHSWHATFYVTPHGLTTGTIPAERGPIEIDFDLRAHRLRVKPAWDQARGFALEPMSTASFYERFVEQIESLKEPCAIHGAPNEIPDALPFAEDRAPRPYQAEAVERFHDALQRIDKVFRQFRTSFLGKVSPSHLFWGSFDLAVTRFSGRSAPLHPGGIPALPDPITREAYSHEVSSAGFWPGGGPVDEPMFYSYAYPSPPRFAEAAIEPAAATYSKELGEFLLPYRAVRQSDDPEAMLLSFLQSTYRAAADAADWDRAALECQPGVPGKPRPLHAERP